jgi:hypothetical protein
VWVAPEITRQDPRFFSQHLRGCPGLREGGSQARRALDTVTATAPPEAVPVGGSEVRDLGEDADRPVVLGGGGRPRRRGPGHDHDAAQGGQGRSPPCSRPRSRPPRPGRCSSTPWRPRACWPGGGAARSSRRPPRRRRRRRAGAGGAGRALDRVRAEYNGVRLHEAIGYVTPDDEHEGRGEHIRQARVEGLARAAEARKDHRRRTKKDRPETRS